jgi:GNAT superfamily N-acetyltransferase
LILRPGRDDDAAGFISLVGACWDEYPGAGLDVDGENPELRALASYFAKADGALWVHEQDGAIAGMIGTKPLGGGVWELCKVYTRPGLRGSGLAPVLLATAEAHAAAAGATEMQLWSDTKFDRAHRFYEKHGYIRSGPIRVVDDKSNTLEFAYMKPLAGRRVLSLDVAAAGSAVPGLAAIIMACTAGIGLEPARAQVRAVAKDVALGRAVLLAAWQAGRLAGAVTLDLAMPAGRGHAGMVRDLLVHPDLRRNGVGSSLLAEAEAAARRAGRRLLTAELREGDGVEMLLHRQNWVQAGRVPGLLEDGGAVLTFMRAL